MPEIDRTKQISVATLREVLEYDSARGVLVWRQRDEKHFDSRRACNVWNARFAGTVAGRPKPTGYAEVSIFDRKHSAHRVIYAMVHGRWPLGEIDHINGNRADNRIENLRDVSRKDNAKNLPIQANNSSGVVGVAWRKKLNKWHAYITVNRKQILVGFFDSLSDAKAARQAAAEQHNFHRNHGRTA
jgi:hypothetical protein